ncbi:extracellular solute-binding protein [Robbsia sp. Bb-Pol-6]|uniref:Extracellular solute-binding protein n=1 Tax=Robbsia betulipollinis TaxID=2981849 RepID=A0ABT3ZIN6_9BURK|nr:extracellular solute-binding protein [Robbsia betulipollinis]MCY0386376.1 extracellular solute-binding protein [Robbsia betulipollinis]
MARAPGTQEPEIFKILTALACVIELGGFGGLGGACGAARAAPAIAQYGAPRYAPGFTHFDYVDPHAPKGGTLTLANPNRITRFDTFNPYILRGNPAPGIDLLFDTLTVGSGDEASSAYGLLADDIAVAADGLSVRFHINPAARFSNGDPVTAADVKYSFDTLMSQAAAPNYRAVWADVSRATVIDPQTVRFDFRHAGRELPLTIGALPVFSPKWGQRADGSHPPFDAIALEKPIGSGPYTIASYSGGTQIVLQRNPRYWAADLPVRRGMFNFDRIVYKLYGDPAARLEALKAGEFDASVAVLARDWVRGYTGGRFNDGRLIKRVFKHSNDAGMQGFFVNIRRPLFQDVRVRQALDLALDFPYLNRQLFYNQYSRSDSFFTNSELAAHGLPDAGELALLEPLRAQLDPAVFGPMALQPDTAPPGSLRDNLRRARTLLAAAGWTYRDGALRDRAGQPFVFEILDDSGGAFGAVVASYARNLAKLGITVNFRTTDFALYQQRLQNFDFDMTTLAWPGSQSPGNELLDNVGSAAAGIPGSGNLVGIHSPAVDALVQAVLAARTRPALVDAARALDRVLMHGYYVVPQWYSPVHRVVYRRGLAFPTTLPLYYDAAGWILSTWWEAPKAAAVSGASAVSTRPDS